MNVLDLFSGIGGFSLGLERAGMRTVAFCEIDKYCRRVLAKHWPLVDVHEDVTQRGFVRGEADVISAGFPCQDISLAGDGAGLAGTRSGLYRHVIRAIRLVRPRFAVLENVSALLNRGLDTVLGDLAEIGYDAEWHCIPASAVGAPHRRDRVWIVADPGGEQHESDRAPFSGEIAAELSKATSHADCIARPQCGTCNPEEGQGRRDASASRRGSHDLGNASREAGRRDTGKLSGKKAEVGCQDRPQHGDIADRFEFAGPGRASEQWAIEPDVGRVANGVPSRVDRLGGLGNAVVPQIPEIIGRAIMRASALSPAK